MIEDSDEVGVVCVWGADGDGGGRCEEEEVAVMEVDSDDASLEDIRVKCERVDVISRWLIYGAGVVCSVFRRCRWMQMW